MTCNKPDWRGSLRVACLVLGWLGVVSGAAAQSGAPNSSPKPDYALITDRSFGALFNGTNLDGWIVRGGKANYAVQDGMIVGTVTMKGGGNTFLCTEKEYGDFTLELEINADPELNSGVQIRSHCFDEATTYEFGNESVHIPAQRVHGYQVEVDQSRTRRWGGGIYDEARRNWLFPLGTNSAAGQAYKFGEWNKYRIHCHGSSIQTWVNDVPAADLLDAETLKGFIGLQVHATDHPGLQVRFRNLRFQDLGESEWVSAWDCQSLEGMQVFGNAQWDATAGILRAHHAAAETQSGMLMGRRSVADLTVRFKYKVQQGGFALVFRPTTGGNDFSFPFSNSIMIGKTNFARAQGWNIVTAAVQRGRLVLILNGQQLKDTADPIFAAEVYPGLSLAPTSEADVEFKDFEILNPSR